MTPSEKRIDVRKEESEDKTYPSPHHKRWDKNQILYFFGIFYAVELRQRIFRRKEKEKERNPKTVRKRSAVESNLRLSGEARIGQRP